MLSPKAKRTGNSLTDENRNLATQIQCHHLGLGSLPVDNLGPGTIVNKTTGLEASAKFQEKLIMKKRDQEANLLVNRLAKLRKDQDRLEKQISIANKNSDLADSVMQRKAEQDAAYAELLNEIESNRQQQQSINLENKACNELKIKQVFDNVAKTNFVSRQQVKANTIGHNDTVTKFRNVDLSHKQQNAANMYQNRKEANYKAKYDKDLLMQSILRENYQEKSKHVTKRTQHESKISQLTQMEERLVNELHRTQALKTTATDILQAKSPALKKGMEPRQAYRFREIGSPRATMTDGFAE